MIKPRVFDILLTLSFLIPCCLRAADKPNIVFAFADDWGRHAGAYAKVDGPGGVNDVIGTPNFDRMGRTGGSPFWTGN